MSDSISERSQRPDCVITTALSLTVIVPTRVADPSFAATTKATGLSPARGMLLVMVIQGTFDCAVQIQVQPGGPKRIHDEHGVAPVDGEVRG